MELINFLSSDPSDHFSFKKGLVAEYFVCVRLMAHLRLCTSCMPTTSSLKITSSFYGGGRWKKKKLLIEIAAAADCFASFLLIYLTRKTLCFINLKISVSFISNKIIIFWSVRIAAHTPGFICKQFFSGHQALKRGRSEMTTVF